MCTREQCPCWDLPSPTHAGPLTPACHQRACAPPGSLHSFLRLSSSHCVSSSDGHWCGCSCVPAFGTILCECVQTPQDTDFSACERVPRSQVAGSCKSPSCNFLRTLQTVFHSGCPIIHYTEHRVPFLHILANTLVWVFISGRNCCEWASHCSFAFSRH